MDHNIRWPGCRVATWPILAILQKWSSDALQCTQTAGAIVTDLPYGRLLEQDRGALRQVLQHTAQLAPQAVYLADEDITPWLHDAGYARVACYRVRKRHTMSRYVHHAWDE